MPEILKPDKNNSEEIILARAVEILAGGGIIAYPTETFYGLGADATNPKAIEKIFIVKGRDFKNPISLIIGHPDDIYPLVKDIPESAKKLMAAFWPGALTIIFAASDKISPLLTAGTGKIGLRVSSHPIALRIVQKLKSPLTATSANLSGAPECAEASEVIDQIGDKIDAIVDFGQTPGDKASTIIDVTCTPPVILREGTISKEVIVKNIGS
ncbi:MAG: threonylcarbamoyl-AMP synthase [Deltaproteobacteria bacterium HGW-Deltaproteobacteria-13]|jgi:L-threonylcarbamoyladenylate synthase|nr:MAG: threonylcarbamoyl-AMP synthase [Deltaproteobacteria bacterium HGW-Deltaproteobacteria-13]